MPVPAVAKALAILTFWALESQVSPDTVVLTLEVSSSESVPAATVARKLVVFGVAASAAALKAVIAVSSAVLISASVTLVSRAAVVTVLPALSVTENV